MRPRSSAQAVLAGEALRGEDEVVSLHEAVAHQEVAVALLHEVVVLQEAAAASAVDVARREEAAALVAGAVAGVDEVATRLQFMPDRACQGVWARSVGVMEGHGLLELAGID